MLPKDIKITITGIGLENTPKWDDLQAAIRSMLESDSESPGQFTRIDRTDKGCNYRALGTYDITYTPETGDDVAIVLQVTAGPTPFLDADSARVLMGQMYKWIAEYHPQGLGQIAAIVCDAASLDLGLQPLHIAYRNLCNYYGLKVNHITGNMEKE